MCAEEYSVIGTVNTSNFAPADTLEVYMEEVCKKYRMSSARFETHV